MLGRPGLGCERSLRFCLGLFCSRLSMAFIPLGPTTHRPSGPVVGEGGQLSPRGIPLAAWGPSEVLLPPLACPLGPPLRPPCGCLVAPLLHLERDFEPTPVPRKTWAGDPHSSGGTLSQGRIVSSWPLYLPSLGKASSPLPGVCVLGAMPSQSRPAWKLLGGS